MWLRDARMVPRQKVATATPDTASRYNIAALVVYPSSSGGSARLLPSASVATCGSNITKNAVVDTDGGSSDGKLVHKIAWLQARGPALAARSAAVAALTRTMALLAAAPR